MTEAAAKTGTLDRQESEKFGRIAAEWWDPKGKFAPLHRMAPARLAHLRDEIGAGLGVPLTGRKPFAGLRIVDVGCGGGLVAEPMARLGAAVTGLDAAEESLAVARAHAEAGGLSIEYRNALAETLAAERPGAYDVVLALEIIEHVADPLAFVAACGALARPGGIVIFSTINRTAKAYALAIVAAERVLRWVPEGSHHFEKLVRPDELSAYVAASGLKPTPPVGLVYNPILGDWRRAEDVSINYFLTARKPGAS